MVLSSIGTPRWPYWVKPPINLSKILKPPSQASSLNSAHTHFLMPDFNPDPYSSLIFPALQGQPEAIAPICFWLLAFEPTPSSPISPDVQTPKFWLLVGLKLTFLYIWIQFSQWLSNTCFVKSPSPCGAGWSSKSSRSQAAQRWSQPRVIEAALDYLQRWRQQFHPSLEAGLLWNETGSLIKKWSLLFYSLSSGWPLTDFDG